MAQSPPNRGRAALGVLGFGAKFMLKQALQGLSNSNIADDVAKGLYFSENPNGDWPRLSQGDKALWKQRVQKVIMLLSDMVSLQ